MTGATGRQGRAVCRNLLGAGFDVIGLVRNPEADAARELDALGVRLVTGSMDDVDSLDRAFAGADGVFSMQNFWQAGYVREFEQAFNVLEAARNAGIKQFVYSSLAFGSGVGLPHVETKLCIESLTRRLFPEATIIRGAWFMEGYNSGYVEAAAGEFRFVTAPDQKHGWVCMDDIGRFATRAFQRPECYAGTSTNLVSGFNTGKELATEFGRALGLPLVYRQMSDREIDEMSEGYLPDPIFARELKEVFRSIRDVNFTVDPDALRRLLPDPTPLASWVQKVWLPAQAGA